MTDLRTSLHRVADAVDPLPVNDDLWQRGVAARRRGQALVVAAVVAIIASVTWSAVLLGSDDREARTASGEVVEGGAIPSRIVDPADLEPESDLAVGRASVAFASSGGQAIVVTAADGSYHALELPDWDGELVALSPDGSRLAWTVDGEVAPGLPGRGLAIVDLVTGEETVHATAGADGDFLTAQQVSWASGSQWLTWSGGATVGRIPVGSGETETYGSQADIVWTAIDDDGTVTFDEGPPQQWPVGGTPRSADIDGNQLAWGGNPYERIDGAVSSPTGNTFALSTSEPFPAADFLTSSRFEERPLATDLYPDGAAVRPLGWATDTLVLAQVDAPEGSYVEGSHLALFTAPNTPEQQWTYRVVAREVTHQPLSVAVDLLPDLDDTSSQQLTYDFPAPPERDISWIIGLGVAAAIAVLMAVRWLWRRLLG
ncbi:hypothetical protein EUA06_12080 [Nocardioides glacieisoli]|uniref:WD40 repeat domain-containing protein n=1 Tax=Nocardioides glacieisoli TaxID=1168730 RepID=A0A4Q2RMQ7_9ACTN|nr:hypothetical protein [Nocardioides glacieisoli]RYB90130.1 hypothetical protein EUA06_12080 [Nocardioides glacieisoli]